MEIIIVHPSQYSICNIALVGILPGFIVITKNTAIFGSLKYCSGLAIKVKGYEPGFLGLQ